MFLLEVILLVAKLGKEHKDPRTRLVTLSYDHLLSLIQDLQNKQKRTCMVESIACAVLSLVRYKPVPLHTIKNIIYIYFKNNEVTLT